MFYQLEHYKDLDLFLAKHRNVVLSIRPKGGCAICEKYAPHFKTAFEKLLKERDDFVVAILPIDEDCLEHLEVCGPTILFFVEGKEKKRIVVESVPLLEFENTLEKTVKEIFR